MRSWSGVSVLLLGLCHAAIAHADGGTNGALGALGQAMLLVAIGIGIVILAAAVLVFRSLRSDATPLSQSLVRFVVAVAAIGSFGTGIHLMSTILSEAKRYAEGRDKFEGLIGESAFDYVIYQMSNWAPGLFWCAATFAYSVWALARIRRNRRRASMNQP